MNWYVLYTKSRNEKAVAEKLALTGIEAYCPILRRRKLWSDRWKWIEEPLLRSYCFVYINAEDRDKVFTVPGIVRYLYHCGRPAIVPIREIELLKKWLMQYEHESIDVISFNVRDKIVIRSGVLIDKEAKILENKGNFLVLFLKDLGVKVKVDLRKNLVEKLKFS